jgi:hypothetical protein
VCSFQVLIFFLLTFRTDLAPLKLTEIRIKNESGCSSVSSAWYLKVLKLRRKTLVSIRSPSFLRSSLTSLYYKVQTDFSLREASANPPKLSDEPDEPAFWIHDWIVAEDEEKTSIEACMATDTEGFPLVVWMPGFMTAAAHVST